MSESQSSQEKTEQPTPKKLQQAKEKGQVARSKELGTAFVLIGAAIALLWFGRDLAHALANIMADLYQIERQSLLNQEAMLSAGHIIFSHIASPLASILIFVFIAAIVGNVLLGGVSFSTSAMAPTLNKMSPLKGFARMFGIQALVELTKAIAKFAVVAGFAYVLLTSQFEHILQLSLIELGLAVEEALVILALMFLGLCCGLLFIVMIDAPYQLWDHNRKLKMTKQEVKDEHKDTEGKPEVKSRIKQLQREISQRKMMAEVPTADVVIVNPEHYAVALKYEVAKAKAPFVVAKGTDEIAFKIRQIAKEHEVVIVPSAALARAVYYTTKLNQQIPEGLFTAVAQVLAYVMQLQQYQAGVGERPSEPPSNPKLDDEFVF
ncbi:flagellar biosynthesis protein FlhB [Paraferrimonas sp. SM1919]|uniref:flagellar biosynthesis protein FlhB n=1 Tax=Paraferrimonas sp. SM1919 TaxID=2662263 RepID=UPI0013D0FB1F|nr:flagellar biosynthesis protein FlhB [Paraferrimonas sp. SM1919]